VEVRRRCLHFVEFLVGVHCADTQITCTQSVKLQLKLKEEPKSMQLKRYNVVSFAKQHGDLMHFYRNLSAWFSVARRFRHCWRTSTACETSWPEYLPTETFLCHLRHVTERKACGKCQTYQIVAKRVILSLAYDQGGYHIFIYWGVKLYTWRQKWNRFIRKSEQLMVYLGGWFVLQCWCSDL